MNKKFKHLQIDLSGKIDELKKFKMINGSKFEIFLGDLVNQVYDCYELISNMADKPTILKNVTKEESEEIKNNLTRINSQSGQILDILEQCSFESKTTDRLFCMLEEIEEEMPEIMSKLK